MTEIKLLHAGFDTVYVAIQGALDGPDLDKLKAAREVAQQMMAAQPVVVGAYDAQLGQSGQRGGYAYRLEAGPTDIVWSIKHNTDPRHWNLFASIGSRCLLALGLDGAKKKIWDDLKTMGARWTDHSINRIDFAMDFHVKGLTLDYKRIVAHPHTGLRNHMGNEPDDTKLDFTSRGRRVETITIGKTPGRQVTIYDKRREAIKKHKPHWFKVWGIDPKDRSADIYRVEIRAGKKHLKDQWQLSTFLDIENAIGDVIQMAAEKVRYLDVEQEDSNISRQALHPLWIKVQESVHLALEDHKSGLTPGQLKVSARSQAIDTYQKLYIANAIGLAAALGLDAETAMDNLPHITHDTLSHYIINDKEDFQKRYDKARQKLRFIEDDCFDVKKYRAHISRKAV